MTDEPIEPEEDYALVMPFVVCEDQGGPFNAKAFVAGAAYGQHDAELRSCPQATGWAAYVIPEMVPQYDLLAMHHNFVMESEPWDEHPDDWVLVTFSRATPEVDE